MLDRRLLILTGKGGVGRSALTAALGILAARRGLRALVVGMTDALGLAAHLRVERLDYRAHEVRPGLFALAVDPAAALDEYLRIQLHVPRLGPMTRGFRLLADTIPGIRDTVTIGKVLFEHVRGDWDIVIADGPPIGQIGSYLRAPSTIEGLVPRGRVEEQAAWMREALEARSETGLLLITLAEELPVIETLEAIDLLEEERLAAIAGIVVNRVMPSLEVDRDVVDGLPPDPHRQAALLHIGIHESQGHWMARLPPARRLPYLFGVHTPGEVAARLADLWEVQ